MNIVFDWYQSSQLIFLNILCACEVIEYEKLFLFVFLTFSCVALLTTMTILSNLYFQMANTDDNVYFEYPDYEEFRRERLQLNHESTLKLWYSLPAGLPSLDNQLVRRQTPQQQRSRVRSMKFFAFYCTLFKNTFLKQKIHSKGKC